MPEYLAPGVYIEETSFRAKSIEGVSTTTTGFIGPSRYGPVTLDPEILTSLLDYERVYGDRRQLRHGDDEQHNYLWHAVRAFFEEGGKRLYVSRVYRPLEPLSPQGYVPPAATLADDTAPLSGGRYRTDGHARCWLTEQTAAVGAAGRVAGLLAASVNGALASAGAAVESAEADARAAVDTGATPADQTRAADAAMAALRQAATALDQTGLALASAKTAAATAKTEFAASTIDTADVQTKFNLAKLASDEALRATIAETPLLAAATAADKAAGDVETQRGTAETVATTAATGLTGELSSRVDAVRDSLKLTGQTGKAVKALTDKATAAKTKADEAKSDSTKRSAADTAMVDLWTAAVAAVPKISASLMDARRARAQADADQAAAAVQEKIDKTIAAITSLAAKATTALDYALAARVPRLHAARNALTALTGVRDAANVVLGAAAQTSTAAAAAASAPGVARRNGVLLRARFPGDAGNVSVRLVLRFGQNALTTSGADQLVRGLQRGDLVWISSPTANNPGTLLIAGQNEAENDWFFSTDGTAIGIEYWLNQPQSPAPAKPKLNASTQQARVATLTVEVVFKDGSQLAWSGLALQPGHRRAGADDSVTAKFDPRPAKASDARELPIVLLADSTVKHALDLYKTLFAATDGNLPEATPVVMEYALNGGNDGVRPTAGDYEGLETPDYKTGLRALEDFEDISIVAAPGSTQGLLNGYASDARSITNLLISHAQKLRYCIAVLDSGDGQSIGEVLEHRGRIDSKYAALYYPWVTVLDPVTRREIALPPSGFVAGIYARNDIQRAVWKAPANEVVNLAIGFERMLNKAQQEVLNPEGVNCFRFFEGRGFRLWGARTISSDPEWKYVNVRRYFAYLERSIDKGTQWAVFEPNGEALWANVRRTIEDFLLNEWQSGALLGDKPEKAYFVRCDRSTMSQNDLDNGRLICLIGVAPLKPAEFVIFRIGQWTSDRKN
ncbi:MAG: phage tail sheath family protein [Betaproteobacteria bacterium]|jgi:hypothetical protein|nr:phage tail sheath subtilisin-like domain-containing protein [Betaproteobacteria bacterium]